MTDIAVVGAIVRYLDELPVDSFASADAPLLAPHGEVALIGQCARLDDKDPASKKSCTVKFGVAADADVVVAAANAGKLSGFESGSVDPSPSPSPSPDDKDTNVGLIAGIVAGVVVVAVVGVLGFTLHRRRRRNAHLGDYQRVNDGVGSEISSRA